MMAQDRTDSGVDRSPDIMPECPFCGVSFGSDGTTPQHHLGRCGQNPYSDQSAVGDVDD